MDTSTPPAETSDIHWIASWGDRVKEGDLIKVSKLGGAVKITQLRKFPHNHGQPRPVLVSEDDDGHWYYGAVVQDKTGREFHLTIMPHEAVYIALALPAETADAEGVAPDGASE